MSPELISLLEYPNVHLCSRVSEGKVRQLVRKSDCYLDINSLEEGKFSVLLVLFDQNYRVFADNDIY